MLRHFIPRNDGRVCAFTLAEVLITLVIIGVVAALTIPNLMQKYTEQTTVKKVQKFYSNLSNAYSLAMKENGPISEWGITGQNTESAEKIYELLFKPNFKIAKNCGTSNTGNCIKHVYHRDLSNAIWADYTANYGGGLYYYKVILNDGAAIWWSGYIDDTSGDIKKLVLVFYDINGSKEPNTFGKDTFRFDILDNKVYPLGAPSYNGKDAFRINCRKAASGGIRCAAWVIYKGNMDYLHCDGLDWNKNSCKDK